MFNQRCTAKQGLDLCKINKEKNVYLGRTELGDPLGGLVSGTHDKLVIDGNVDAVVLGNNLGLEDTGVLGVGVNGLEKAGAIRNVQYESLVAPYPRDKQTPQVSTTHLVSDGEADAVETMTKDNLHRRTWWEYEGLMLWRREELLPFFHIININISKPLKCGAITRHQADDSGGGGEVGNAKQLVCCEGMIPSSPPMTRCSCAQ